MTRLDLLTPHGRPATFGVNSARAGHVPMESTDMASQRPDEQDHAPRDDEKDREAGFRALAAMGTELGLVIAVLALGGWWLDRKMNTGGPWFLLTGALVGIVGGLYKFWQASKRFFK